MFGTYQRLRVSTFASNQTVVRAARRKLTDQAFRDPSKRDARKAFYRQMLAYHAEARKIVREWRL